MDTDFKKGVVDPSGLVFGVENLFVADASIFPSSGGANPSLTVAACSMKIADQFVREKWKN
jgi:choline dehydrogenase-like flavoprotein